MEPLKVRIGGTKPRSRRELEQIAYGMQSGSIFADRMAAVVVGCKVWDIFVLLAVLDEERRTGAMKILQPQGPGGPQGMVFEWMAKAIPGSVEKYGYPKFFSMQLMDPEETRIVLEVLNSIKGAGHTVQFGVK